MSVKSTASRDFSCDFIRVAAMGFVILNHVPEWPTAGSPLANEALAAVIVVCNGLFFMLSGHFNLRKTLESPAEYRRYYVKKTASILWPYVLVTFLLAGFDLASSGDPVTLKSGLRFLLTRLMSEDANMYLWFMYPLAGMLLGAPFLAKMLSRLSRFELDLLLLLGLLWDVFYVYLGRDTGLGFEYSNWLLGSWTLLFYAGFWCEQVLIAPAEKGDPGARKGIRALFFPGIAGYLVTVAGRIAIPAHFFNSLDLSPAYVLFTMAFYVFLRRNAGRIRGKLFRRAVFFIAKYSFLIFMIHGYVISVLVVPRLAPANALARWLSRGAAAFILSLAIAWVLDHAIISPVKRLLLRLG